MRGRAATLSLWPAPSTPNPLSVGGAGGPSWEWPDYLTRPNARDRVTTAMLQSTDSRFRGNGTATR